MKLPKNSQETLSLNQMKKSNLLKLPKPRMDQMIIPLNESDDIEDEINLNEAGDRIEGKKRQSIKSLHFTLF